MNDLSSGDARRGVQTIASHYYTDPTIYDAEKERIFYRSWQFAGHVTDFAEPGSYRTLKIADESLILTKGRDGEIRAFYNVCRHRAHRLVEGSGHCRTLVCPYHAWIYDLEGRLVKAPGAESVADFDPSKIRLSQARLETLAGFLFVNLDDEAPALSALYPGLEAEILAAKPGLADMVQVYEDHIDHASNWKVSVENFSECYHCPVAHKFIVSNSYSGPDYRISIEGGVVRHFSPGLQERELHGDLHIWHIWPNVAIELYPLHRSVSVRNFAPKGPRATTYTYLWYADPDLPEKAREAVIEMGRTYRTTNGAEDEAIVANVQLGLESRAYDRGPLVIPPEISHHSEHAVAHFQSRYLAAMGE